MGVDSGPLASSAAGMIDDGMLPPSVKETEVSRPTLDPDSPFRVLEAAVNDAETCCEVGGEEDRESDDKERPAADCNKAGLERTRND